MGLYIHSLSRLPSGLERDYYVYVLDYGWEEPLGDRTAFAGRRGSCAPACTPRQWQA
jgi:hypothetical protein